MTQQEDTLLERQLQTLTRWEGRKTSLWRDALSGTGQRKAWRWLYRPVSTRLVAAILLILLPLGIIVSVGVSDLSRTRTVCSSNLRGIGQACRMYAEDDPGIFPLATRDGRDRNRREGMTASEFISPSTSETVAYGYQPGSAPGVGSSSVRMVARKASIELATPDVRGAYHKAIDLIKETSGEYVQDSNLTGDEKNLYAQMTIRVASNRLNDVLNSIRQLGTVRSEQIEGQDVTSQIVDLDARLRNEQRIEKEILELLDKRHDSPLKDILELRDKLRDVRREIEQLTAQKEQMSRLISLATLLVVFRDHAVNQTEKTGIAQYFEESCSTAWNRGLTFLADTVGFIVGVLVGGAIWWILATVVVVSILRWRRKCSRGDREGPGGNP